jgi:hypothetical protein
MPHKGCVYQKPRPCWRPTESYSPCPSSRKFGLSQNAILRHQLIVLERQIRSRVRFTNGDRLFFMRLYSWFASTLDTLRIIRPETRVRWHRAGFRRYWRWKSRAAGGRPPIDAELRALIRQMSVDNPPWDAPRIHGELLKLGFEVAQSSVAKYMIRRPTSPSQGWLTFLRNHSTQIAAMDPFVAPSITFELPYVFIVVRLARRELIWINVVRCGGLMERIHVRAYITPPR